MLTNVFELDLDSSTTAMLTVIQNIASDRWEAVRSTADSSDCFVRY